MLKRRLVTGLAAQGAASLSNIAISLLVAKSLGASELGRFSLLFAVLTLATAMQSGWVGDGLAVLGPASEAAARWWQHVLTAAATLVTGLFVALTGRFSWGEVVTYLALAVTWLYEEYARRWFMAHQKFLAQGMNDLVYFVVAFASAWILDVTVGWKLQSILIAMVVGALSATLVGQAVIPRDARVWRSFGTKTDVAAFRRYGMWRSAQAGTGALGTVGTRTIIAGEMSLRALGDVELARNMVAPAMTLLGGLANVLLPVVSADARERKSSQLGRMTAAITIGVAVYGAFLLWQTNWIVGLLGSHSEFRITRLLIVGWLMLAMVIASTQAISVRAIVVLPSRVVFIFRTAGTLVGLVLVAVAGVWGSKEAVPFAGAAGALISAGLLRARLSKVDRSTEPAKYLDRDVV